MSARPLVVRCGAFGDMVMLSTLIRLLATRHGAPIDVLSSGAWTPPLLAAIPEVGHLQLLTSRNTPYLLCPSQWAAVRWLRRRGRGPVYLCDGDAQIRALLRRGGVAAADLVDAYAIPDLMSGLWPDRWLLLGQLDAKDWPAPHAVVDASAYRLPLLRLDASMREDAACWRAAHGLGDPLVLFQPGNKRTHKRGRVQTAQHPKHWPARHWAAVAHAIWRQAPQTRIVLCGSPREHGVLEEIRTAAGDDPRLLNAARELPVPRLLALIEGAAGMLSVDTGPAHAAAALGCPLLVLFGSAPVAMWRPIGPGPIRVLGGERGDAGRVADLGVDEVVAAWSDLPLRDS